MKTLCTFLTRSSVAGLAVAGPLVCSAEIELTRSDSKPTNNVVFSIDSPMTSGLSIRWRGNPTEDNDDTDGGGQFTLCGMLPGAQLQALTVRIGAGQSGVLNPGAPGLPLILDFYQVDPLTTNYTLLFRETGAMPLDAQPADYLTFDLSSRQLTLSNTAYAYLIGSNEQDADLANEPHRFRLSVNTADWVPGCFEIRREGNFGVDAVLGAPDPRPGGDVPPNVLGPESREPVFYLQATVPTGSPEILGLTYTPEPRSFTIEYQSEAGVAYTVRRAADLADSVASWPIIGTTDPGTGSAMMFTDNPPDGDAQFYVLTGSARGALSNPIPLDDFEDGPGDWMVSNPGGTATQWELGAEAWFALPANSGENAWITDLDSNYLVNTATVLSSPELDLTGYTYATLQWAHYRHFDSPSGDRGLVNVVDVTENSTTTLHTATADDLVFEWETFSMDLPASVMGHTIRIEFVFEDDSVDQMQFSPGWMIDDVGLTICP